MHVLQTVHVQGGGADEEAGFPSRVFWFHNSYGIPFILVFIA